LGKVGKDADVAAGQRILVVEGLTETAQVLKTVLEPRGTRVDHLRNGDDPGSKPSLLVVHSESIGHHLWDDVPRIVIGAAVESADDGHQRLPSLFQYGDLLRAIGAALDRSPVR
jgi:hypothetical protein